MWLACSRERATQEECLRSLDLPSGVFGLVWRWKVEWTSVFCFEGHLLGVTNLEKGVIFYNILDHRVMHHRLGASEVNRHGQRI